MIIVRLMGGMGNQMFQYALGRSLAMRRGTELKLDLCFLRDRRPREFFTFRDFDLDVFNIQADFASGKEQYDADFAAKRGRLAILTRGLKLRIAPFRYRIIRENHYDFDAAILDVADNSYLIGYWQSYKYFQDIEGTIRRQFEFKAELDGPARAMAERIRSTNSVCVNVRRGDYVSDPRANEYHGVCGSEYYWAAERVLCGKTDKAQFFVFSDEVEWCERNLTFDGPTTFVGHDCAGKKFGFYLRLMSECRHFIIPNSSFAWWAAWLCRNPGKTVIAPKAWFADVKLNTNDLTPSEWIRI